MSEMWKSASRHGERLSRHRTKWSLSYLGDTIGARGCAVDIAITNITSG